MEPFDKKVISSLKKSLKEIGKQSLNLCHHKNSQIEDTARDINKLAHDSYELIWLLENAARKIIDMDTLNEKGVPLPKDLGHKLL